MVRKVAREWDLLVVHSIFTGWCFSKINTFNLSLLLAWIVFLCDLVYSMDVLARASKKTRLSKVFVKSTSLELFTIVPTILSCIPYHVLVAVGLDFPGVYLLLCSLRVARLLKSGRIHIHFDIASLFPSLRKRLCEAFTSGTANTENMPEVS